MSGGRGKQKTTDGKRGKRAEEKTGAGAEWKYHNMRKEGKEQSKFHQRRGEVIGDRASRKAREKWSQASFGAVPAQSPLFRGKSVCTRSPSSASAASPRPGSPRPNKWPTPEDLPTGGGGGVKLRAGL
ncbi:hypothetical protein SKAU_G00166300 [Synaphobranchus kaupii]|uniref:Uncharacterized protein n=1 Tax=Synaphobranchus kaupii TaxID=118154 RepID=A0A9Q1J094_SYNKA|nr:hypothetical protein SKAU_G00166300 [Synaphobranchus kaupii]